ncbi:NAD-dependent succinate-semialdehyde dehydrogenase [Sanyastnella coralliicola]|uniref:NAD-dependent succinate-semialdehyde dehydrogenase n=1 Tax=Sanyastnella coralliicola TaxID=3069118 RepID=UPI0027B9A482|nr:NAD-dependent succinate-semialdehyde dehydrogenase [Longitalea sp. SCSIO 12813]
MFNSTDPYTQEQWASYEPHSSEELDGILSRADEGKAAWHRTPLKQRTALIRSLSSLLLERKSSLATTMTKEMGKPFQQGVAEVEKCAWLCRYYAEEAATMLADETIDIEGQETFVRFDPLGVVLGVMPWNYPLWQVFRFIIPALAAGNVCVLKHASNVFASAESMTNLLEDAGFPSYALQALKVSGASMDSILSDPRINAVTLTGSEKAGANIAMLAGKHIKPSLLELGGSNAFIVLNDADLEQALEAFTTGRFQNNGQSCIAAKRLLLQSDIHDSFLEALVGRVQQLKVGDPNQLDTDIGPMAREDLAIELEQQMTSSIAQGAELLVGGTRNKALFEPTVLAKVTPEMDVFKEETFGPLAAVTVFETLDEAIALSNNSKFGLGVSVFTTDKESIREHISSFAEGAVFINDFVKSDPRVPFGGVKISGYGRELGRDGILSFVNRKAVVIK